MTLTSIFTHLPLITAIEAESLFGVPNGTIYYWLNQGFIGSVREIRNGKEVLLLSRLEFQLHLFRSTAGTHMRPPAQVKIAEISLDQTYQLRVQTNPATVQDYASSLERNETLPPITLARVDSNLIVPDGHHRLHAHLKCNRTTVLSNIIEVCTHAEAVMLAAISNRQNALQLTRADRRKIATTIILSPENAHMTCEQLGQIAGYCSMQISRLRRKLLCQEKAEPLPRQNENVGTETWLIGQLRLLTDSLAKIKPTHAATIHAVLNEIKPSS